MAVREGADARAWRDAAPAAVTRFASRVETEASRPALRAACEAVRAELARFATMDELLARGEPAVVEAERLLRQVRIFDNPAVAAPATPRDLRVVHWNIEHGNRYASIARALRQHPALRDADVVSLNEVDLGMARAANRDVAVDLADELQMHAAWAPMFHELTCGRHDDPLFAGDTPNHEGCFGLALLSRWPIGATQLVALPSFETFGFNVQRMYGRHCALVAEILHPAGAFRFVTVHLNVHGSPPDRDEQIRIVLDALGDDGRPVIICGDFNTTTFWRRSFLDGLRGLAAIALTPSAPLRRRLTRPDLPVSAPREPLFTTLRAAGFAWESCVDFAWSLMLRFDRLNEIDAIPPALHPPLLAALRQLSRRALLRLDWIVTRGFGDGREATTVHGLDRGPAEASDHLPIAATFPVTGAARKSRD